MKGLCECGCGGTTGLPTRAYPCLGIAKGEPRRFMVGHKLRRLTWYRQRRVGDTIQLAHRIRAEQALGKPLPPKAVVHHVDGTTSTNSALVICQDQSYHQLLHARDRILRNGGNPNTQRWCMHCKQFLPKEQFIKRSRSVLGTYEYCRECKRKKCATYNLKRPPRIDRRKTA